MRKFIVLAFASKSQDEVGEIVHLGTDRGEAIASVNQPDDKHARREMYELAQPEIRRWGLTPVEAGNEAGGEAETGNEVKEGNEAEAEAGNEASNEAGNEAGNEAEAEAGDEVETGSEELNVEELYVSELKDELKARGLEVSGNKPELQARLLEALSKERN